LGGNESDIVSNKQSHIIIHNNTILQDEFVGRRSSGDDAQSYSTKEKFNITLLVVYSKKASMDATRE